MCLENELYLCMGEKRKKYEIFIVVCFFGDFCV